MPPSEAELRRAWVGPAGDGRHGERTMTPSGPHTPEEEADARDRRGSALNPKL